MSILIFAFVAYIITKAVLRVVNQYKHLTDEEVGDIMLNRMDRNGSDYSRVIRHLGLCDVCQERLHQYDQGDEIERHLVE